MKHPVSEAFHLKGLTPMPSQVFGAVRLVPLVRATVSEDLRIGRRRYHGDGARIDLGDDLVYGATYVPHGLVIGWTDDGSPVAGFGASLRGQREAATSRPSSATLLKRMVRREEDDDRGGHRLRFVPQHLAFEGLLALCFGGPEIAWTEYSKRALSRGLDPRSEWMATGHAVGGLEDALRMFEIHEGQCGALLFVGDLLAEVFVVSHPDDYRDLHGTLVTDSFADTLLQATAYSGPSPALAFSLEGSPGGGGRSIEELRAAVDRFRADVGVVHVDMASGVLGRPVAKERVHRAGRFSLERFMTALDLHGESHIGEAVFRDDGAVEYAKTYRLSAGQQKRAFLLQQLSRHGWSLTATASTLGQSRDQLLLRIERAGFGYLLAEHVLMAAKKRAR